MFAGFWLSVDSLGTIASAAAVQLTGGAELKSLQTHQSSPAKVSQLLCCDLLGLHCDLLPLSIVFTSL